MLSSERAGRGVPDELVDREVSCRLLPVWFEALEAAGYPAERLAEGTGCPTRLLQEPRERISWDAFRRFMANAGRIWSDDDLRAIGGRLPSNRSFRSLMRAAGVLYDLDDAYGWLFGPGGPAAELVPTGTVRLVRLAPCQLEIELSMRPAYAPSRENFVVMSGVLAGTSTALGYGPATVEAAFAERSARYRVDLPAVQGRLARLGRTLRWPFRRESRRVAVEDRPDPEARVEAIGGLAARVGHDLNNLLTVIHGCNESLGDALPDGDPRQDELRAQRLAIRRAGELARQLLTLAGPRPGDPPVVELGAIVREHEGVLRRVAGDKVRLECLAGSGAAWVRIDAGGLGQVLLNLVANARDASPDGGVVTVAVGGRPADAEGHVTFTVTDGGTGIDEATQARLFEPYFTTKPRGRGTGIGLAIVSEIVERSGGSVSVESQVGRGTTFRVSLPPAPVPGRAVGLVPRG